MERILDFGDWLLTWNINPLVVVSALAIGTVITAVILGNVLAQLVLKNPNEPPVVFHLVPFIGSTIQYGIDPFKFFFKCREKVGDAPIYRPAFLLTVAIQYGDVFTFVLLGKKTTVCLGTKGNDFILNGKLKDVCAEEVYTALCTPVFGKDVVYDCPNSKLMEQKKACPHRLTSHNVLN